MEKTTVYLTTAQKEALARAAAAEGRSEARLIRAGIDVVTARHRVAETPVTLEGATAIETGAEGGATGTAEDGVARVIAGAAGAAASPRRPRWLPRDEFVRAILRHQADPALRTELRELAPDTTDDTPLP